jgi:hypothetical protein
LRGKGIACTETALRLVEDGVLDDDGKSICVRLYSACEIDERARELLLLRQGIHAPEHVFGDILDRVEGVVLAKLIKLQTKFLEKAQQAGLTDKKRGKLGKQMVAAMRALLETMPFTDTAHCHRHGKQCPLKPCGPDGKAITEQMLIDAAGTTCKAWSHMRRGSCRAKWLHESTLPCLVWIYWLKHYAPDAFLHECTARFDHTQISMTLQDFFTVPLVFSPVDIGIPSHRLRKYTIGINVVKRCVGLLSDDGERVTYTCIEVARLTASEADIREGWAACFQKMFFSTLAATASVFLQATDDQVDAFADEILESRGLVRVPDFKFHAVLKAADFQRMLGYRSLIKQKLFCNRLKSDCIIVDLQQTSGYMNFRTSAPVILTHSMFYAFPTGSLMSLRHGTSRLLLPLEYLAVQAFPIDVKAMAPGEPDGEAGPLRDLHKRHFPWAFDDFTDFRLAHYTQLIGNSMNIAAVGSILLFVLCMCGDRIAPAAQPRGAKRTATGSSMKRPAAAAVVAHAAVHASRRRPAASK